MGGERGWSAASSCRDFVDVAVEEDDDGDRRKNRNPNESTAARTRVTGLVRRMERVTAMVASQDPFEGSVDVKE